MTTPDASTRVLPRAAASAVVLRGGEVLLVERGKAVGRGLWSLPGGHIEPGERAIEAARREIAEETGVEADLRELLDVHDVILRDRAGLLTGHYVIAVYAGLWRSGEPAAASDSRSARFVSLDHVSGLALTPGAEALVRRAAGRSAEWPMQPGMDG